jgi:hypothetical protein
MIGEEFALEKDLALALPAHGFDACVSRVAMVDKYQTVRVECCRYSVPREYAFQSVTVKLYAERRRSSMAARSWPSTRGSSSRRPPVWNRCIICPRCCAMRGSV